jgi:hypothetical protein
LIASGVRNELLIENYFSRFIGAPQHTGTESGVESNSTFPPQELQVYAIFSTLAVFANLFAYTYYRLAVWDKHDAKHLWVFLDNFGYFQRLLVKVQTAIQELQKRSREI